MKIIPLTQGLFTLVDDADYESLSRHKWFAHKSRNTFYAERRICINGIKSTIKMHRVIMGDAAAGLDVDHRDGDGLNNRRANLRACTNSENQHNQKVRKDNATGFKGVSAPTSSRNTTNKYRALIKLNGKDHHLGRFPTAELAHAAYCEAAKKLHGEFARLK